jgi:hypothetical protein
MPLSLLRTTGDERSGGSLVELLREEVLRPGGPIERPKNKPDTWSAFRDGFSEASALWAQPV